MAKVKPSGGCPTGIWQDFQNWYSRSTPWGCLIQTKPNRHHRLHTKSIAQDLRLFHNKSILAYNNEVWRYCAGRWKHSDYVDQTTWVVNAPYNHFTDVFGNTITPTGFGAFMWAATIGVKAASYFETVVYDYPFWPYPFEDLQPSWQEYSAPTVYNFDLYSDGSLYIKWDPSFSGNPTQYLISITPPAVVSPGAPYIADFWIAWESGETPPIERTYTPATNYWPLRPFPVGSYYTGAIRQVSLSGLGHFYGHSARRNVGGQVLSA